jgi:hypothetical protein
MFFNMLLLLGSLLILSVTFVVICYQKMNTTLTSVQTLETPQVPLDKETFIINIEDGTEGSDSSGSSHNDLDTLYDVEIYTQDNVNETKPLLEHSAGLTKMMEKKLSCQKLTQSKSSAKEEIFMVEMNEPTQKMENLKFEIVNLEKTRSMSTTEEDSLFQASVELSPRLDDDLDSLLGTPMKLRSSVEETEVEENLEMTWSERRCLIFNEILETERSYVKTMNILMEKYVIPSKNYLNTSTLFSIFGEIEMIIGVNKKFLDQLEILQEIENQDSREKELGILLKSYFIAFKLYGSFISNYNQSQNCLRNSILKNAKFHNFLQTVRGELVSQRYRMQTLNSYLISPIQRLPRY